MLSRSFSSSAAKSAKVAVLGAAGGIGQPLSLLLKQNKNVTHLALYDIANSQGVAADLSHICTGAKVTGHKEVGEALKGADVVIIPAGVARKPGMSRDDLFNINASTVAILTQAVAQNCPKAQVLIISNPVNSTVPIAAEVLKKAGVYDPAKLYGVTTLDVTRAKTFVSENLKKDPKGVNAVVIGGHAGTTIVPILSGLGKFSDEDTAALTKRIQFGGDEVVNAKAGAGSATLSMAYAGYQFADAVLRAMNGEDVPAEPAFVDQKGDKDLPPFFALPVKLGKNGVQSIDKSVLSKLNKVESENVKSMMPELKSAIEKGIAFGQK